MHIFLNYARHMVISVFIKLTTRFNIYIYIKLRIPNTKRKQICVELIKISSNIGFRIKIKTLATIIDNLFTSIHGFFFSAGISDISPVISVPTGIRKYRPYRYTFYFLKFKQFGWWIFKFVWTISAGILAGNSGAHRYFLKKRKKPYFHYTNVHLMVASSKCKLLTNWLYLEDKPSSTFVITLKNVTLITHVYIQSKWIYLFVDLTKCISLNSKLQ
jgi:hypothetical protein